ncbi:hypothetical protein [Eubacterium sp.]
MREFRKKQKRLKKIMNSVVIVTAVYLFVYIGVEPVMAKSLGATVTMIAAYLSDILVVASMAVLFLYFSKYGKSDKFLESVENELSDTGYYFTARQEKDIDSYYNAVVENLRLNSFSVDEKVVVDDFEFTARATKGKSVIYILKEDEVDKNDLIAYQESAIYDLTSINLKRKADVVMLYICDHADDGAVSLSKMITPLGRKEQIKIANAVVEVSTSRCYFLGNKATKCQQLISNYAMNVEVPIKDEFKGKEQLPFQAELEEHMKEFNIKDFKAGTFYAH